MPHGRSPDSPIHTRFQPHRRLAVWLGVNLAAVTLCGQVEYPGALRAQPSAERTHQLFVGVDLFLPQGKELLPVINVAGNRTIVRTENGENETVGGVNGYRWKRIPRISRAPVTIENLENRTVYSPAKDPSRNQGAKQTNIMNQFADELHLAQTASANFESIAAGAMASAPLEDLSATEALINASRTDFDRTYDAAAQGQELATNHEYHERETRDLFEHGSKDALELTFEVSSPEVLAHAYAVLMIRVRNPDGNFSDATFHKFIGDVGPKPRKVFIMKPGFQPGFETVSANVHIFNNGKEIATNMSEKRLDITSAEARQYLLLDHVASHRNETIPAAPVWHLAPADLRATPGPSSLDVNLVVEIDETGTLLSVLDSGVIVPAHIHQIVRDLPFVPALDNGTAVESQLTLNLADYFR